MLASEVSRSPLWLVLTFASSIALTAAPTITSTHLHVDQFGYRPDARKIAVVSDPQVGFNAAESFDPGPRLQVRRWSDDAVAFEGPTVLWRNGAVHDQSGDRCWQFDFSTVTTPGTYYLYSPSAETGSGGFEIARDVYRRVAIQAARMFFYQRSGYPKEWPYVNHRWTDGAAFLRDNQDPRCRLVSDRNNPATERDLRGGWFDAGDYNKYVTYAWDAIQSLLLAYEENPRVWGEDHAIPESGNGVPDLLDEVRWEMDWLLRMQEADGSVLNRVHDVSGSGSGKSYPASADNRQRCYGAASTASTIAGADMYAHAARVFRLAGGADASDYADRLTIAAERAWAWALANPSVRYDDTPFGGTLEKARSANETAVMMVRAAVKLFAATGKSVYREFFDANYRKANMFAWNFVYVFEVPLQDALLYYQTIPGATASVVTDINAVYARSVSTNADNMPRYLANDDPFRAFMGSGDYTWGSSRWKADRGNLFHAVRRYGLAPDNAATYRDAAAGYLHYLHGKNPMGLCYLSNMSAFGAERSASEFYHHWFANGSEWDSALNSPKGPPPGFLVGGPNPKWKPDPSYRGPTLEPPANQPWQKSFRDWNTSWPENSWEVTEPAIYYQAAYIRLLANFLDDRSAPDSYAVNLGARAVAGSGEDAVYPGFLIAGSGNARVLVRAVGPTLAGFGVAGALPDPTLTLYRFDGATPVAMLSNDDWGQHPAQPILEAARLAAGAFPLPSGSRDAALVIDLTPGLYTAKLEGVAGAGGVGLIEVYDTGDTTGTTRRLANLSCRARVGTGNDVLIPGIVLNGKDFATLLIRGVGPALATFGVRAPLADPRITLFAAQTPLESNDSWSDGPDSPLIARAARAAGAFPLPEGSPDAALLVRVPPGAYSIQLSGQGPNPTGVGMVEVYVVTPAP